MCDSLATADALLNAVEGGGDAKKETLVVVVLTAAGHRQSERLRRMMEVQAQKWVFVHFCSIDAQVAQRGFDQVALPAMLFYRGGRLVHSIMRVTLRIGDNFSIAHVEKMMLAHSGLVTREDRGETLIDSESDDEESESDEELQLRDIVSSVRVLFLCSSLGLC